MAGGYGLCVPYANLQRCFCRRGEKRTCKQYLLLCMTGTSIARWSERHYNIPAQTRIQKELDTEAPDDWMQSRFIEWKFLDGK